MLRALLLFVLFIPAVAFSQAFIDQTKKQVREHLESYQENKKYNGQQADITETDSTITLSAGEPATLFIYSFDETGRCKSKKIIANCDSCYKTFLDEILAEKNYNWKKLNENQYISDFDSKMMIELSFENGKSGFTILRIPWTKEVYKLVTEQ